MSWFYDALKRVEQENRAVSDVLVDDGASFLGTLESIATGQPSTKVENSVDDLPQDQERETVSELAGAVATLESPEVKPTYRHLSLPVQADSRLVFDTDPHGLAAEQYRMLRRNLIQDFSSTAVVLVTSPGEGDGKTLTAFNLASCLADVGDPTLLLELDIRRPTVGKLLGGKLEAPGIEDALSGRAAPYETICCIDNLSLHVAAVVQVPKNPSQVVNGKGVQDFIAQARNRFRWIIVDSAPVVPAADVADLLSLMDGVLLVVRAQSTPKDLCKRAFELIGRRLHGIVFNEATVDSNPYYRYLSHYYHGPNFRGPK